MMEEQAVYPTEAEASATLPDSGNVFAPATGIVIGAGSGVLLIVAAVIAAYIAQVLA